MKNEIKRKLDFFWLIFERKYILIWICQIKSNKITMNKQILCRLEPELNALEVAIIGLPNAKVNIEQFWNHMDNNVFPKLDVLYQKALVLQTAIGKIAKPKTLIKRKNLKKISYQISMLIEFLSQLPICETTEDMATNEHPESISIYHYSKIDLRENENREKACLGKLSCGKARTLAKLHIFQKKCIKKTLYGKGGLFEEALCIIEQKKPIESVVAMREYLKIARDVYVFKYPKTSALDYKPVALIHILDIIIKDPHNQDLWQKGLLKAKLLIN